MLFYISDLLLCERQKVAELRGQEVWKRNDLFDLYNLAYVRRGDKYWTNEKKWIKLIKEAGCEKYLYTSD